MNLAHYINKSQQLRFHFYQKSLAPHPKKIPFKLFLRSFCFGDWIRFVYVSHLFIYCRHSVIFHSLNQFFIEHVRAMKQSKHLNQINYNISFLFSKRPSFLNSRFCECLWIVCHGFNLILLTFDTCSHSAKNTVYYRYIL